MSKSSFGQFWLKLDKRGYIHACMDSLTTCSMNGCTSKYDRYNSKMFCRWASVAICYVRYLYFTDPFQGSPILRHGWIHTHLPPYLKVHRCVCKHGCYKCTFRYTCSLSIWLTSLSIILIAIFVIVWNDSKNDGLGLI